MENCFKFLREFQYSEVVIPNPPDLTDEEIYALNDQHNASLVASPGKPRPLTVFSLKNSESKALVDAIAQISSNAMFALAVPIELPRLLWLQKIGYTRIVDFRKKLNAPNLRFSFDLRSGQARLSGPKGHVEALAAYLKETADSLVLAASLKARPRNEWKLLKADATVQGEMQSSEAIFYIPEADTPTQHDVRLSVSRLLSKLMRSLSTGSNNRKSLNCSTQSKILLEVGEGEVGELVGATVEDAVGLTANLPVPFLRRRALGEVEAVSPRATPAKTHRVDHVVDADAGEVVGPPAEPRVRRKAAAVVFGPDVLAFTKTPNYFQ